MLNNVSYLKKQIDMFERMVINKVEELEEELLRDASDKIQIADEKERMWSMKEAEVAKVSQPSDKFVKINVRGVKVEAKKSTLLSFPGSLLANTFSEVYEVNKDPA